MLFILFIASLIFGPALSNNLTRRKAKALGARTSSDWPKGRYWNAIADLFGPEFLPLAEFEISPTRFFVDDPSVDLKALKKLLERTPDLTTLSMNYLDFSDEELAEILAGLPKLYKINLSGTKSGEKVAAHLEKHFMKPLGKDGEILLDGTCVSSQEVTHLRSLKHIRSLSWAPACGQELEELQQLAKLAGVYISTGDDVLPTNCFINVYVFLNDITRPSLELLIKLKTPIHSITLYGDLKGEEATLGQLSTRELILYDVSVRTLSWLTSIEGLQTLDVRSSDLSQVDWAALPGSLEQIHFSDCQIPIDAFAHLDAKASVRSVSFYEMGLKETHLADLARLELLEEFVGRGCGIHDAALARLIGDPVRLVRLNLSGNHLTDEGLRALAGASRLTSLDVTNNSMITNAGLPALLNIPNLEHARLVGTKVTQAGADAFLQKHDLKKLRLEVEVERVGRRIM